MKGFQARIHKKVVRGCVYYCIIVPADLTASRRRAWEYFKTRQAAMARAAQLNGALLSRKRAAVLTEQEEADAVRAFELMRDLGLEGFSLRQAVEAAAPRLRAGAGAPSLGDLVEAFRAAKAAGWSALSLRNFNRASGWMLERFGDGVKLVDFRAEDLGAWLEDRFPTAGYRANVMRTLSPAFNWAVRRGMLAANPLDFVERPRLRRGKIEILSVDQARRALDVCPPASLAAVVLMLFGGIRPKEVERLRWGDVLGDIVHLTEEVTKTAQVRNVPINETLGAWLAVCERGDDGASVVPRNWIRRYQEWRAAAGIGQVQDVLRHSFATYHLRLYGDEAALRQQMGHSRNSDVMFAHYLAAATPAEAAKFWALRPELDA